MPYYLEILFQSIFIQAQVQKAKAQTGQPKIADSEINKLLIPDLFIENQFVIQQKVIESLALRKHSKHLLECAKRAVEIAIEQDVKTAIEWLEKETCNQKVES